MQNDIITISRKEYDAIIQEVKGLVEFYHKRATGFREAYKNHTMVDGNVQDEICSAYANGMSNAVFYLHHRITEVSERRIYAKL